MSAQSVFPQSGTPINWRVVRPLVGIAFLVCEVAVRLLPQDHRQVAIFAEIGFFILLGVGGAVLSFMNSRSFGSGQTARWVWLIIALMPLSDAIAYFAYTSPAIAHFRSKELILVSTLFLSVSRILAAFAFWSMFRVYQRAGLKLELRTREYAAMAVIIVIEVVSLYYAHSGALASGGPDLARMVFITAVPMVIALVPCSVLGVMIWQYTTKMGGGLVAKAWRNILLYGMGWLSYTAFHAVVAYYFQLSATKIAISATMNFVLFTAVDLMLKGGEYLMFLGASFQYEACTGTPEFSEDMASFGAEAPTPA